MSKFYSALMLARHVSDFIGPSSGAFCTSCTRRLWYVVLLCVLLDTSSRYGCTCRVVRVLPNTKVCKYSLYKMLLMRDRWGPKHVELTYVLSKTYSLRPHLYLVGLHIHYKMIHGRYNVKLVCFSELKVDTAVIIQVSRFLEVKYCFKKKWAYDWKRISQKMP